MAQTANVLRKRLPSALRRFLDSEAAGGLLLVGAAGMALVLANSPAADVYFSSLDLPIFGMTLLHWINDGLMAVFFLLVGLEIKREMLDGQLQTWSRRALPGIGAVGGMLVPALIYIALNLDDPLLIRGWAIPAATDIAFALGILSLLGPRVPVSLKIFLTTLAILDDLGAVVIIALFYTSELSMLALGLAGASLAALIAMNRFGVTRLWPYLLLGIVLWALVLQSGVHATLAGVALALTIPLQPTPGKPESASSPLHILEHGIQPWVAFLIVPIFGLANAGVTLIGTEPGALLETVPLGIALGLFLGKQVGVFLFSWATIRCNLADLPAGASWLQFYGVGLLCGIGFTMSLFIGALAFPGMPEMSDAVKIGVLAGSLLSALSGWLLLRLAPPSPEDN